MTPSTTPEPAAPAAIAERVGDLQWYHTFDLPGGITTPGQFDHRRVAPRLQLPDLTGKRCLDAASADGFWTFEMVRRGADSVVSLDLADTTRQDWQGQPPTDYLEESTGRARQAFGIVRDALGVDNVERVDGSLYDVSPELFSEPFDFIFLGNILLHLADPTRALRALATVLKPGGELFSFEAISLTMTFMRPLRPAAQLWHQDDPRWWTTNLAGHRRLLRAAGYEITHTGLPVLQPFGPGFAKRPRTLKMRPSDWAFWAVQRNIGVATAWARAVPR